MMLYQRSDVWILRYRRKYWCCTTVLRYKSYTSYLKKWYSTKDLMRRCHITDLKYWCCSSYLRYESYTSYLWNDVIPKIWCGNATLQIWSIDATLHISGIKVIPHIWEMILYQRSDVAMPHYKSEVLILHYRHEV